MAFNKTERAQERLGRNNRWQNHLGEGFQGNPSTKRPRGKVLTGPKRLSLLSKPNP